MKQLCAVFAVITLAGCMPDQAKDVAVCRSEADRFYQGYYAVDVENPRSQYIIGCMTNKGYDFTILPLDCNSQRPLAAQPACYRRNNWLAWIVDQFGLH